MKQRWTEEELEEFWTLHPEELKLLQNKSEKTRLSFSFMLKYFQVFCRFPNNQETIPQSIILHMAKQIGITETNFIKGNLFSSSVAKAHRQQIRDFLGFRFPKESDVPLFINWLVEKVLPDGKDSISFLQEKSYAYFQEAKVEPFSPMKIERYIRSALTTFEKNLFLKIFESLDKNHKKSLLDLVVAQDKHSAEAYYLRHLKEDAGNVSLESILEEVTKTNRILEIGLPASLFKGIPHRVLEKYKARIMSERPSEIRDHKDPIKYATLAMFCYVRGREIADNLVDLLIQVIHKIGKRSENKVNKKIVTELKKVYGKQAILIDLARVIVDNPDGIIKEIVYPVVKAETLQEIIKESKLVKGYKEQVYTLMRASYGSHYRRMLSPILETISFQSNNAIHQPVLEALKILKKYLDSTAIYYPVKQRIPIKGVVKSGWQEIIVEKIEKTSKRGKKSQQERVNC